MLQASLLDGLSFDPFSFQQDGFATSEVDVGGREVFKLRALLSQADNALVLKSKSRHFLRGG
jgi:hypothetical protein